MLKDMREEAIRDIKEVESLEQREARYWSYIGALGMVQRLGFITSQRRDELSGEASEWKDQAI